MINSVASLGESLPQLLKKISEWNLLQEDVPNAIENFRSDLKPIQECLTVSRNHIRELDKYFGKHLNFKKLCIDTDHCFHKLKQLETQLNNIHIRTQKKCICFSSTRVNRLEDLLEHQTTLASKIETLIESINSFKAEYNELENSYVNMAPLPETNLIFNFEDQSPERRILD